MNETGVAGVQEVRRSGGQAMGNDEVSSASQGSLGILLPKRIALLFCNS
jgi:chemotaxis response regulator CheB